MFERITSSDLKKSSVAGFPSPQAILEALATHSVDALLLVDAAGEIVFCNQELPLPGLDALATPGLFQFLPVAHHARCREALRSGCELGQSDSFDTCWSDGTKRHLRVVPVLEQLTPLALVIASDVSDRLRAEEALKESEARFRQLAENVREVFWLMEATGRRVLYVTNAYQRIWGRSAKDLYEGATDWFEAIHPDDRVRVERSFAGAAQSGGFHAEYRIMRPDGALRWIRDRGFPTRDAAGRIYRIAGIAEDITDQRNVEDSLRLERKLLKRLLDLQERERHLLACEIHDGFIQDLVGAKMLLESLQPQLNDVPDAVLERVDTIEAALRKAIGEGRRMISNLRPMVIDDNGILAAIEYLINEKQPEPGPLMTFHHDVRFARLPALLEGALFRIVQESLTNARRHSGATTVQVELTQAGERVLLTISDNGVGFDRGAVPEGRFGLRGLMERARLFGGRAEVRSAPGQGTRIWVELPINKSGISI